MAKHVKNSLTKMYCSIIGHQFQMTKEVTTHIKEYKCVCCGYEVTTNSRGAMVPLTEDLRETHLSLQSMIAKRRRKHAS